MIAPHTLYGLTSVNATVPRHLLRDPASGLGGLFAEVALDRIMSIETLSGSDGFRVIVRMYDLGRGDKKLSDELTLRAGTNLSGDDCALLVADASGIGG
jgi:hypothetical protein